VPLLQAAFAHRGTSLIDIVSPCVTFNDHAGSTKSYTYVKEHELGLNAPDFIRGSEDIVVDYEPGTAQDIELSDGSHVVLRKVDHGYDATDATAAMAMLRTARERHELMTGLLYVNPTAADLCEREHLIEEPLRDLNESELRIGRADWDQIMEAARA
jgi:2-oxoglutarate ferredoxin oxidoreductase subunit beta